MEDNTPKKRGRKLVYETVLEDLKVASFSAKKLTDILDYYDKTLTDFGDPYFKGFNSQGQRDKKKGYIVLELEHTEAYKAVAQHPNISLEIVKRLFSSNNYEVKEALNKAFYSGSLNTVLILDTEMLEYVLNNYSFTSSLLSRGSLEFISFCFQVNPKGAYSMSATYLAYIDGFNITLAEQLVKCDLSAQIAFFNSVLSVCTSYRATDKYSVYTHIVFQQEDCWFSKNLPELKKHIVNEFANLVLAKV